MKVETLKASSLLNDVDGGARPPNPCPFAHKKGKGS
jgi:hypothetical protein